MTNSEINTAVAEKIMGWTLTEEKDMRVAKVHMDYNADAGNTLTSRFLEPIPNFAEDMNCAVEAWTELWKKNPHDHNSVTLSIIAGKTFVFYLGGVEDLMPFKSQIAETPAKAICLAMLEAVKPSNTFAHQQTD